MDRLVSFLLIVLSVVLAADGNKWMVYFAGDYEKEPLCAVLNCGKHEACLVKNKKSSICVKKRRLRAIDGKKFDYKSAKEIDDAILNRIIAIDKFAANSRIIEQSDAKFGQKKNKDHKHIHSSRHEKMQSECDEKEMRKMGGRLLQWFSDVHSKAEVSENLPLPRHHVRCRRDISWMFQQWDGDVNGELSAEELRPLDQDKKEKCLSTFLDRCDTDADEAVSLDEWCDCFAYTDDLRHEPPCMTARRHKDPHRIGIYQPRCDVDGYFKTEQCHERHCWCVDKYGREFDHSRVTDKLPDCGQYAEEIDDDEDFGPNTEL